MLACAVYAAIRFSHQSCYRRRVDNRATAYVPFGNTHVAQLRRHACQCALDIDSEHSFVVGRVVISYRSQVA
jgi:hypothetical protein